MLGYKRHSECGSVAQVGNMGNVENMLGTCERLGMWVAQIC